VWCLCRDLDELYGTITMDLAKIPGLREVETHVDPANEEDHARLPAAAAEYEELEGLA
jgi:hypothetical protein